MADWILVGSESTDTIIRNASIFCGSVLGYPAELSASCPGHPPRQGAFLLRGCGCPSGKGCTYYHTLENQYYL